jgi:hypothetical protein
MSLKAVYLHSDQSVVDEDFFGKEIGAYGCFVARAELLVDILVHQTRLSDTRVTKYLPFQSTGILQCYKLPTRQLLQAGAWTRDKPRRRGRTMILRRTFFRDAIVVG